MKVSVFIGTSLDGFIARPNGAYDFLPVDGGEPHGYTEFFASIDALIIGRKTFEIVMALPEWPYGGKHVVVLSSRALSLPAGAAVGHAAIEQMRGAPDEILSRLAAKGLQHIYLDGGITIQRFLCAGLVDRLTITRVPVLIGEGIPLFGTLPHDMKLLHVATQAYASGLVKSEYEVVR